MSETDTTEAEEIMRVRNQDEQNNENKQNNAMIYLVIKEGYKVTIRRNKKENSIHKCIMIENEEEKIDGNGLQELGKDIDEMIKMKINKEGNDKEIILEPKDIFDDGKGFEREKLDGSEKKDLPSPFA
ncbi:hypothetical protein KM1_242360 [Entamoeba histolytica HM-3:IMSS]|uniref:Uncharacterized protein n=5 Tax=Entamoeba histolytica TaxID=5759 RepID=C4LV30_ENTH1|nr:hypothetical protein EHI_092710 [Entamoeba histolytica HM-1:IMSS]EMD46852.1 Hypothetical protein EHI5A_187260 [Entamoeba histolytica KU27]EMS11251.1 hypothetical protein KM1_242360 [Entamoeba histolytica HM-3:IMSS]ENY59924.1 hypothetical protein EHI7A_152990 [Entamoeba histolytica HM-1:IMSS-A]GAT92505.1 hypothetical protein CL6EHI_092710 [Entamoeba histolytica]EAL45854.1 hypothetical protein EHI_092710 [Entamoeba histolytica HM-1:IMSS]|eukprot:XP_651241.1 hypothetical protein EHI_092710 [Entamoeba histolytica HM-1:IMSS]